ncbi:MAG: ABC transporter permease [Desulfurococcales archaeon]|nr:ABC transporter permease [Desulfurococcales archaeon]
MKDSVRIVLAIAWAHMLRTWRMRIQLVNWAVTDALWILLIIYAILAFTDPSEYGEAVPLAFWSVVAWSLVSSPTWVIGNWVKSYIFLGLMDANEVAGVSHKLFLALRVLPSVIVSLTIAAIAAPILYTSTGIWPATIEDPPLLLASLTAIVVMAVLYSLSLAWIGLRLEVPGPILDIMNLALFAGGGVGVDLSLLPHPFRSIALIIPYSHPAELLRYAATGNPPYLGLWGEVLASLASIAVLALAELSLYRLALKHYRSVGPRGVGFT